MFVWLEKRAINNCEKRKTTKSIYKHDKSGNMKNGEAHIHTYAYLIVKWYLQSKEEKEEWLNLPYLSMK